MTRNIFSVIAGYAIFVVTSLALFKLSGQNPHADPTPGFAILAAIYGILFSLVAGLVAHRLSKTKDLTINYVLALIIAAFATFSLVQSAGHHWTQLLAIFVFAPASILGGWLDTKRYRP